MIDSYGTRTVFQDKPDQILRHYYFVQPGDVGMKELSVMVDLSCQVRVIFLRGFEHHLRFLSIKCFLNSPLRAMPWSHW